METMSGEADQSFSDHQKRVLSCVLDEIIPPSGDGKFPGAGQAGVAEYLDRVLRRMPDLRAMVTQGLADLEGASHNRYGQEFVDLARDARAALLNEQGFVFPLTLHAYAGYYQTGRVVEALGLETRPPHPGGYTMEPNDLTLLDPVRRRPKMFRNC
jgi:hypothetical protein